jgi:hypothetical protein
VTEESKEAGQTEAQALQPIASGPAPGGSVACEGVGLKKGGAISQQERKELFCRVRI